MSTETKKKKEKTKPAPVPKTAPAKTKPARKTPIRNEKTKTKRKKATSTSKPNIKTAKKTMSTETKKKKEKSNPAPVPKTAPAKTKPARKTPIRNEKTKTKRKKATSTSKPNIKTAKKTKTKTSKPKRKVSTGRKSAPSGPSKPKKVIPKVTGKVQILKVPATKKPAKSLIPNAPQESTTSNLTLLKPGVPRPTAPGKLEVSAPKRPVVPPRPIANTPIKLFFKTVFRLFHGQTKKMVEPSADEFIHIPEDLELTPRPLEDEEYFHGFLVDDKVVNMFDNAKNDSFLVRRAQTFCGLEYVLSVKTAGGALRHIIINVVKERRLYWVDRHVFKSIRQLVEFYVESGIFISVCEPEEGVHPICVRLKYPIKRFNWQINHEQIELNQVLGSGQYGEVCKGYLELSFKQGRVTVAVKMVKGGDQLTTKQMYDLVQEAENMKRLQHPNVVRFYGIAASKNPCMMALEFCHGGSLDKRLESSTTDHQKIRFLYQAALGMEYLHDVGIVHGDLAARNCFLTKDYVVKIGDFGLAAENSGSKFKQEMLPSRYIAPEALEKMVNTKESDAWAFSVLMFEVFHRSNGPYFEYEPQIRVNRHIRKNRLHLYLFERPQIEFYPPKITADLHIWRVSLDKPEDPRIELKMEHLFKQLRFRNVKFRPRYAERTEHTCRKSIVGVLSRMMSDYSIDR